MNATPHIRSLNSLFAVALVATAAAGGSPAQAKPVDVVGHGYQAPVVKTQDMRSPDAQDAAKPVTKGSDLRSPDGIDASVRPIDSRPVTVTPATPAEPVKSAPTGSGSEFDWPSAGIGAGTAFGLALLALAGIALSMRRRPGGSALLS